MKRSRWFTAVLAATLIAAACGDDDDSSAPDDTTASAATAAPTTETAATEVPTSDASETTVAATDTTAASESGPVDERAFKVMVIGDETSQISFTVAEAVPSVQGALADLPNVEVLHCDSAGDANSNQECQREAVDAGVAAVIGSFGLIGSDVAVLTEAGIPAIGSTDPAAPNSFSLSAGLPVYASLGVAAAEAGCTKIATLFLDGAEFLANMVQQGAEMQGIEEVARSGIPQNTPDISPQVAALAGADADCVVLSVTPTQVIQAVTALNQAGVDAQLIGAGAVFPVEVLDELGDLSEGIISASVQLDPADDDPVIAEIKADVAAFDPDAPITTVGVLSWTAAKLIVDALPAIDGDVTPASLTAALSTLENAPAGGAVHPVTITDLANPLFARFYNPWGLLYRITDGVPVREGDYFSLVDVLNSVSMG